MELPKGWKIGITHGVSPQWYEEFIEYVGRARSQSDLENLRFVLADREAWCLPESVKRYSDALQSRASELGCSISPVRSSRADRKPPTRRAREDITDRMTGEAQ